MIEVILITWSPKQAKIKLNSGHHQRQLALGSDSEGLAAIPASHWMQESISFVDPYVRHHSPSSDVIIGHPSNLAFPCSSPMGY